MDQRVAGTSKRKPCFIAGLRFRSRFLRGLAAVGFLVSINSIFADPHYNSLVDVAGHMTLAWVFVVLFHAVLFYVNRALSEKDSVIGLGFSWAGSLLLAVIIGNEAPVQYAGIGCLVMGALLFEFGKAKQLSEFRQQGYCPRLVRSPEHVGVHRRRQGQSLDSAGDLDHIHLSGRFARLADR